MRLTQRMMTMYNNDGDDDDTSFFEDGDDSLGGLGHVQLVQDVADMGFDVFF